jgi:hypothetical protein
MTAPWGAADWAPAPAAHASPAIGVMVGAVDPAGLTLSLGAGDLLHEEDDDLDDDLWEAIR